MYVVCKMGNESQNAVQHIINLLSDDKSAKDDVENKTSVRDLIGGLYAWSRRIDKDFPTY